MKSGEKRSEIQVRDDELYAAYRRRYVAKYRSLVLHWMGRWFRRPRRAELAPLPPVEPGQVAISFAGHATTLLRYSELSIVCDPMLGKWAGSAKREVAPGLSPADLHDVQLILISHSHKDHLHPKTLAKLPRSATVILPPRTAHKVSNMGFARVVELGVGESVQYCGVDIFTAAVRHGENVSALSYYIRGDGPSIYFCGDSGYFSGFAEVGRRFRPDIAMLPIGGYAPSSFRERHMTPLDALYAFEDLQARVMIPIHYGSFALSYEKLRDPSRWLAELIRERALEQFIVELRPGESRVFVPPEAGSRAGRPDSESGTTPAPDAPDAAPSALGDAPIPVQSAEETSAPFDVLDTTEIPRAFELEETACSSAPFEIVDGTEISAPIPIVDATELSGPHGAKATSGPLQTPAQADEPAGPLRETA